MSLIKSVRGFTPVLGKNCYIAETAAIIGDVIAGDECSFWFNVVVRGDVAFTKGRLLKSGIMSLLAIM
jgi:carbonic anhydrase/acetyltransferase-like protein (isoleucine patch superfamily)